jgi:uncharacterized cupin superfamily protein
LPWVRNRGGGAPTECHRTAPSALGLTEEAEDGDRKRVAVSNVGSEDYEAYEQERLVRGHVHWLRVGGGRGRALRGPLEAWPAHLAYVFPGDETFHVLEGEVTIEIERGEPVTLRPGDIASFAKDQSSIRHITEPFEKAFVISG